MSQNLKQENELNKPGTRSATGSENSMGNQERGDASSSREESSDTPLIEWCVAILGLLLVLGAVGYLLYHAVYGEASPPDVAVHVEAVTETSTGFLVKFRAVNQGGTTAEGVIVQGTLRRGNESAENSQTTIDYLPSHSVRKGGLFFTQDPRKLELQVRAFGYQEP